jgi:acetylornithine deacetylase/succinyl-diaminopimelate desuccinylase-like protein
VPGTTSEDVAAMLADALGDLAPHVEVIILQDSPATESPTANPLWDAIVARTQVAYPGAELIPGLIVGGTDARYFRDRGAVAYGAGLFSPSMSFETFGARFHGNDERIDVESLRLATDFWIGIAEHMLT